MTEEVIRCLSMGAGVQTTAILLKFWERYKNGYIIFADTGDEKKETYWYIETYLKPFCKEKGLRWQTVYHKHGFSLMEWCLKRKIIPIRTRRWCTQDFKIKPINRFLRKIGATKRHPVHQDIGISLDESHRANFSKKDVKYVVKEYPLLDAKLTRRDCYEIIAKHGWPLPPKSGCDFCPYVKRKDMRKLLAEDPDRFHKIVLMEQNDRYYPHKPLIGGSPLANLELNQSLDNFTDEDEDIELDTCDSGNCFV
jgi:3'-phosphoadenosine 5'-phosphosulfate sulfotransferase (PAPS reductase)/FAD synthetase